MEDTAMVLATHDKIVKYDHSNQKKRPWCWERLRARAEGGDRGWDGWVASSTQWTWVWASSRRQRRTEKPDVLQFMGLERVGDDLATDQQQTWRTCGIQGGEVSHLETAVLGSGDEREWRVWKDFCMPGLTMVLSHWDQSMKRNQSMKFTNTAMDVSVAVGA